MIRMYEGWIENTSGGMVVVNGNPQMIKGSAGAVFGCLGEETLK